MFHSKAKVSLPEAPVEYPTGFCVSVDGNYYYINGAILHPIIGTRILQSWRFPLVIKTSDKALTNYVRGARLGFRDGSIIRSIKTSTIYIISKREKRCVSNPDLLASFGLTIQDALWVSEDELLLHNTGEVFK